MLKKKFIVLLALFVVAIIVILIVFLYLRRDEGNKEKEVEKSRTISEFSIFELISDKEVLSPVLLDKKIIYYNVLDSAITVFDLQKNTKNVLIDGVPYVNNLGAIKWSPRKNKLIIVQSGVQGIKQYYYDLEKKTRSELSSKLSSVSWSPDGNKIIYQYYLDSKSTLNVANPNGSDWQSIVDLPDIHYEIAWLKNNKVVLTPVGSEGVPGGNILLFDKNNFKLESFAIEDENFSSPKISPFLNVVAFEIYHLKKHYSTIGFYNFNKNLFEDLDIKSNINKTNWSEDGKFLLVAAPKEKKAIEDDIYIIDMINDKQFILPISSKGFFEVSSMIFDNKENSLYYVSGGSVGKLFKIEFKWPFDN